MHLFLPPFPLSPPLFHLLLISSVVCQQEELFASQSNIDGNDQPADGSEDGSEGPMAGDLPDYWRQDTDPESIQQKRDSLAEQLSQPKYAKMREAMAALKAAANATNTRAELPDSVRSEVELMQFVNDIGSKPSDSPGFVPPSEVPSLHRVNAPIGDMLFQGDGLLNEKQANNILDALNGTEDSEVGDVGEHLHTPKKTQRQRRQVQIGKGHPADMWNLTIPIAFYYDSSIAESTQALVRLATKFWQNNTCLSFQENGPSTPRVRIFKGDGCYSTIGKEDKSKSQDLSLGTGCEMFGTITHEFGHILGMFHHHARQDRDDNIQMIKQNIDPGWQDQYQKVTSSQSDLEGIEYNYGSNMHYGGTSDSNKIIMAAKNKDFQHTMGNNVGPVFLDLLTVNKYYGCIDKCSSGATCTNDGFRNPRNCQKCICPEGFGGDDCSELEPGSNGADPDCGQTVTASSAAQTLTGSVTPSVSSGRTMADRQAECHYHIKASSGSRIKLQIKAISGACTPECYYGAVEIKLGDFKKSGIRICCDTHIAELGAELVSDGELVIVSIYTQKSETSFSLDYSTTSDAATSNNDLLGSSSVDTNGGCSDSNPRICKFGAQVCRSMRNSCKQTCGLC